MSKLLQYNGIQWIEIAKDGLAGQDGKNGEDGKTPIKGLDYFTPKDIEQIVKEVFETTNIKDIFKQLEEIRKQLEALKKSQNFGGQRFVGRGGMTLSIDELIGTGDGTTTEFDLDYPPYDSSSMVALHVGGGAMFGAASDYTISGQRITFATAPPSGAKIIGTYRKS